MFRKVILSIGAGLALSAQPVIAQDEMDEDFLSAMMGMFEAEPLTEEQEGRLPLATEVVDRIMPSGTLGEMMGSMFDGMFGSLMELPSKPSASNLADELGVMPSEISVDAEQAAEALTILDPAWEERKKREAALMPEIMKDVMDTMEPGMRKAMSELYAIHFDTAELNDINAFFKTESGANYARKSFTMASDPRIMAASMESMPQMMGTLMTMEAKMAEASADLPAPRGFKDLSASQRARLSELTGLPEAEIKQAMAAKALIETTAEEAVEDTE